MARTINDYYNFIRYIVKKERGVFITIEQAMANLDAAQLDCVEMWFKPYGVDQQVHDALRDFKIYQPFTSNSAGFVTFPSDYLHLIGQPYTVTGSTVNRIEFVNEDELPFALTSQLRPVSTSYPVAVDNPTGFNIYPQTLQVGAYFYLRRPAAPVLDYTQVGRAITYNSAGSTQLEWNEVYINHIIAVSLKYAGINMSEPEVSKFADQYANETT
jgi:hypothetical protein